MLRSQFFTSRSNSSRWTRLALAAACLGVLATGCAGSADDLSETAAPADTAAEAPGPAAGAATPAPTPAAPRAAAPAPAPPTVRTITLNPGANVMVALAQDVVSDVALVGDSVVGSVIQPVEMDGRVMIPVDSQVRGTVIEVKSAKRFGGQAMVSVKFDSIVLPDGQTVAVEGNLAAYAKKDTAKDTATIAGSTAGGALLGKVLGGDDKDAAVGAVVGGAVGTAVASRKGQEAFLPAGSEAAVMTTAPLRATARL